MTNLKINQDEDLAIYFVNNLSIEEDSYKKDLILLNLENFTTKKTYLSTKYDDFDFMGEDIVLKFSENDYTEFHIYNISQEQTKLYCKIPYIVKNFCILNKNLYFVSNIKESRKCESIESGVRFPLYEDNKGFIGNNSNVLFKRNYKNNEISEISSFDIDIDDIVFDLANKKIVFNAFKEEKFKPVASDIYIYHVDTNELKKTY